MKHKLSKRALLVLAMCVTCVLAFGAAFAQASTDSRLGGKNVLVVNVANIKDASAQVNLYRIATGSKDGTYDTYNYTFDVESFKELGNGYDPATMTSDSWQAMAETAKGIVADKKLTPDATAAAGDDITGLPDGLYLVIVPDTASSTHSYTFTPAIVALPGKVDADGSPVYRTDLGTWTNATDPVTPVNVNVKGSMTQLFGSLKINKTVSNFLGEPVTFTYHVVDTKTGGKEYEVFTGVHYTAEGVQSDTINQIPAGMELTVTEIDTGAGYRLTSEDNQVATIKANEVAEVSFQNEPDNSGITGHGVVNHFVYDDNYNGGDWHLEPRVIDASEVVNNNQG